MKSVFQEDVWRNNRHFLNPSKLKEYELHLRGLGFLNTINPFFDYFEKITPIDDISDIKKFNSNTTLYLIRNNSDHLIAQNKYSFKLEKIWGTIITNTNEIRINRNTSRNIKKAEKNLSFHLINNLNDLKGYHNGLRIYRKQMGFGTAGFNEYKKILNNKFYKAFILKEEQKIVAGLGIINNDYYASEINSFSFLPYANDYLKYKILSYCKDNHILYYDFAGCNPNPRPGSKDDGIKKYKEKWGGNYYNVYILKK